MVRPGLNKYLGIKKGSKRIFEWDKFLFRWQKELFVNFFNKNFIFFDNYLRNIHFRPAKTINQNTFYQNHLKT